MKDLKLITLPDALVEVQAQYNDIELGDNNDFVTQEGVTRRTQDIIKILLTSTGSLPAFPSYGSSLPDLVGSRDNETLLEQIRDAVINAVAFAQAVDISTVSSERIAKIVSLQVKNGTDPRTKLIYLVVAMEDGSISTTKFPLPLSS